MWFIILLFLVIAGIILFVKKLNRDKIRKWTLERERIITEANLYADKIKTDKKIPIVSTSIFLESGESAYLEEHVGMLETRAVRKSSGGFGGVRIAKGITVGGYSGTSESHQEWRAIDSGKLVLTNKRIIFDGQKGNKVIQIPKIISVMTRNKDIQLSIDGKAKDVCFSVENGYIWSLVINIIKQTHGDELKDIKLDFNFK